MSIAPAARPLTFTIPYYRHPHFLARTIASLQRQTYENFEVLIIDDGGPDPGAPGLVAAFRDPRIMYLRNKESLGIAGNWNRCVDLAATPLFTILHADDELEPDYAKVMIAAHSRHPGATGIYCRTKVIGADSRPKFSFPDQVKKFLDGQGREDVVLSGENGVERLMRGCFIFCPSLCYNKAALKGKTFDSRWRQVLDLEFYIRVLADGGQFVGIPDAVYRYRRHDGNQTAALTANLERFREEFAVHREVAQIAAEKSWPKARKVALDAPMIRRHLLFLATRDFLGGRWQAARAKMAFMRRQTSLP